THSSAVTVYPASSTASRTAAGSTASGETTTRRPVSRSTSTLDTPGISETSSLTEATQWPQVMPETVKVAVADMVGTPLGVWWPSGRGGAVLARRVRT